MRKRGQIFINLIVLVMGIIIFIFGLPILFTIINESVSSMGTATAFVVKSFIWIIFFTLIALLLKIINRGDQGFFV